MGFTANSLFSLNERSIPFGSTWGNSSFNFTQCALDAAALYNASPNSSFLVGSDGKYTNDPGLAWGITYDGCNALCGPRGGTEAFNWGSFSAAFAQWVLPWLALTAQLPYETKDGPTNMMSLMLAVGSPMLITYSLCITILNSRWLNERFAVLRDENKRLGNHQEKALAAARYILRETQHVPIAIRDTRRRFAELIVTYSLGAQTVWVVVTEGIAVLDFFTIIDSSTIGMGVAINSLWMWLIPITLGWVWVGTQNSTATIQDGFMRASTKATLSSQNGNEEETMVGFKDCSGDNLLGRPKADEESCPLIERNVGSSGDSAVTDTDNDPPTPPKLGEDTVPVDQEITSVTHCPIVEPLVFVKPALAGCAMESGPIFNFARPWSHLGTCSQVIRCFRQMNENLDPEKKKPVSGTWSENWEENLAGTAEEKENWIFPSSSPSSNKGTDANIGMICFQATIMATILQWGTTGAAILMAYNTPVIGLGCESGGYLIYGLLATLVWALLVFSAYLSRRYAADLSCPSLRKNIRFPFLPSILIPATRIIGKALAWINAGWLLSISLLQFANRYNNCWCMSCLGKSGWVILWASNSQVAQVAWSSWVGGVILGVVTAIGAAVFFLNARGEEIFEKQRQ